MQEVFLNNIRRRSDYTLAYKDVEKIAV